MTSMKATSIQVSLALLPLKVESYYELRSVKFESKFEISSFNFDF